MNLEELAKDVIAKSEVATPRPWTKVLRDIFGADNRLILQANDQDYEVSDGDLKKTQQVAIAAARQAFRDADFIVAAANIAHPLAGAFLALKKSFEDMAEWIHRNHMCNLGASTFLMCEDVICREAAAAIGRVTQNVAEVEVSHES